MYITICELACQSRFNARDRDRFDAYSGPVHWDNPEGWDGMEVGGVFRMGNTCTTMADSCECMAETTTILKSN